MSHEIFTLKWHDFSSFSASIKWKKEQKSERELERRLFPILLWFLLMADEAWSAEKSPATVGPGSKGLLISCCCDPSEMFRGF